MQLSPIVLFVYNRPWHTEQTLNALMQNELADKSVLYIYADGPLPDTSEDQLNSIYEVRSLIRSKNWCSEVHIIEAEKNRGLAHSIVEGVTAIINKFDNVIVLEDDIVTSKGFLRYMNDALKCYLKNYDVGCIHGWNYDLKNGNYHESTFFLKGADCWGWATWKRSWILYNPDGSFLLNLLKDKTLQYDFNRRGTHQFVEMLQAQINGENNSWAIRWHASLYLANKYCLQPTRSIVSNIGLDSSGVHCIPTNMVQRTVDFIDVNKLEIKESEWFFKAYLNYIENTKKSITINKWQNAKTFLKHLYRR